MTCRRAVARSSSRSRWWRGLLIACVVLFMVVMLGVVALEWLTALDSAPVIEVWLIFMLLVLPPVLVLWPRRWGRGNPKRMSMVAGIVAVLLLIVVFPVRSTFRVDRRRELRAVVELAVDDSSTFHATLGKARERRRPSSRESAITTIPISTSGRCAATTR